MAQNYGEELHIANSVFYKIEKKYIYIYFSLCPVIFIQAVGCE